MTDIATTAKERTESILDRPLALLLTLDWEKALYATFIGLALVTRLWGLGARVMSHDESLHTQFSLQYFRGDGYNHTPLMHGPFLFHITPLFYWLFGVSDFSARLPVALFGVLLVAMPYLLRSWLGKYGALFTSFFFLISPYITYYSRYIRHDIYVIVWAMIIFVSTWYYLRERKEKYLWWFAGGLALMFSTKEVSFIYAAIFGSFLALRLLVQTWQLPRFRDALTRLKRPLLLLLVGLVVLGAGVGGLRLTADAPAESTATTTPAEDQQGFAADPGEETTAAPAAEGDGTERLLHWLQVAGVLIFAGAIFMVARELRPFLDDYGEFDLIVLFSTLLLPAVSPFLIVLAGYDPTDYSVNLCELAGQADMSRVELLMARATNSTCLSAFFTSPVVRTGFFVMLTLVLAVLVGLWWNRRRWIIAAFLFHGIFFLLYTSVFTNPAGWASGMVGSLGYWLEQQEVQRGSQPWFYYFFVVPFYEFLPLIFSLLAIRLWSRRHRLNRILGYWIPLLLVTLLVYSFSNWLANRPALLAGGETSNLLALLLAGAVFLAGILYWFLALQDRIRADYDLGRSWRGLVDAQELVQFVPMVIWWLMGTWLIYTVAGEKMPWLSTHFVIPMALLSGWYLNEKLTTVDLGQLFSRRSLAMMGLVVVFIVAVFLALKPLLLGQFRFGGQQLDNLNAIGRFMGALALAGIVFYLLRTVARQLPSPIRGRSWLLGIFVVLSLLTARFTYMSSGPNADYATEFMVYAHAAPAVKDVVMTQVQTLSQRLHGDKSIQVAWGDDGTWPMQWYLRDYPNRLYAGQNPSANIADYAVVITGHRDLDAYENFLSDREYEKHDYTFLWWPMEDYRQIGWNALFGLSNTVNEQGSTATGRGLLNADVRQALWDIFFYRDYARYSDVFDKTHTVGQWPLRADLRMYVRRDVLAQLWDYGAGAASIEPPVDPYAEGQLQLTPNLVVGAEGTGDGQLSRPRNLALGPDGNLYVADSNNHRVAVFDSEGQFLRAWGSQGAATGQFNEPWGIAVDDNHVYVADTWNHRVQIFTHEGQFVTAFGQSGTTADLGQDSGGYFFGPRSLALLSEDRILVTDTGNHRLQLFNRDGTFIRTIGQVGSDPGQFNEPVGVASSPEGYVYLADTWNARIQRFTPDLAPDLNWSIDGWEGDSTENKPYLAVDSQGRVYTSDPENFRILIFSPEGQYLARFGHPGASIDEFGLPNGVAIDDQDNVYVADAHNNRVLRFPAIDFSTLPQDPAAQESPAEEEASPATEN